MDDFENLEGESLEEEDAELEDEDEVLGSIEEEEDEDWGDDFGGDEEEL
ncbi:MAG: hypothetical protein V1851_00510 [Patescibacteria group bacterium]